MSDHHAADRDRPVRTPHEIREHINADHPCCIGVGDACAVLEENERLRANRGPGNLSEALDVAQHDLRQAEASLKDRAERIAELEERERDLLAELDSYRSDLINEKEVADA